MHYRGVTGHNCNKIADKDADAEIKFSITFTGVLLFKMLALDFDDVDYESCFDLVQNSKKLAEMRMRDKVAKIGKIDWGKNAQGKFCNDIYHQHLVFLTYDIVFEIIAQHYGFKIEI